MDEFAQEIDEVYSMFLDYEGNDKLTFDVDIAPRLRELFEKIAHQGAVRSLGRDEENPLREPQG